VRFAHAGEADDNGQGRVSEKILEGEG
jgi:hypothetical protein